MSTRPILRAGTAALVLWALRRVRARRPGEAVFVAPPPHEDAVALFV